MIKINIDFFRHNIREYALTFLDNKYVWGAKGPDYFDCSGFTWYIFKILFDIDISDGGYGLGDTTKQMTSDVGELRSYLENDKNKKEYIKDIRIGDLIFFHRQSLDEDGPTATNKYPGHVAIYMGDNKFIHAFSDFDKVIISDFDDYWLGIMVASKDILTYLEKKNYTN